MHRLLVCVIRDPKVRNALFELPHLLRSEQMHAVLFHVVEVPMTSLLYEEQFSREIEEAEAWISELEESLKPSFASVESKVVLSRDAAEAILTEAEESYEAVVLFRRKKAAMKAIAKAVGADTMSRVLRKLAKPVLVVPAH